MLSKETISGLTDFYNKTTSFSGLKERYNKELQLPPETQKDSGVVTSTQNPPSSTKPIIKERETNKLDLILQEQKGGYWEAFKSGRRESVSGLAENVLLGKGMPETYVPQNRAGEIVKLATTMGYDLPYFIAGSLAGLFGGPAAPIVGGAGAMALPTFLRQSFLEYLDAGGDKKSFIDKVANVAKETGKSAVIGGATAGAGKIAPYMTKTLTEVATIGTLSPALEGRLPTLRDFEDNAILLVGIKAGGRVTRTVSEALKARYEKTGELPQDVKEVVIDGEKYTREHEGMTDIEQIPVQKVPVTGEGKKERFKIGQRPAEKVYPRENEVIGEELTPERITKRIPLEGEVEQPQNIDIRKRLLPPEIPQEGKYKPELSPEEQIFTMQKMGYPDNEIVKYSGSQRQQIVDEGIPYTRGMQPAPPGLQNAEEITKAGTPENPYLDKFWSMGDVKREADKGDELAKQAYKQRQEEISKTNIPTDKDDNELVDMDNNPMELNVDGTVTLYHRTSKQNAEQIAKTGKFIPIKKSEEIYFSNKEKGQAEGFGEAIVKIKINPSDIRLDDAFHNGEIHVAISPNKLSKASIETPPQSAQERPVEVKPEEATVTPAKEETVLYHGTNAEYVDADISTGKKMYGIHLTTDADVAKDYGKVKQYGLSKDAKVLDLSDGDRLWEFMKKEGILDKEDMNNIDLENYTKNGQIFQYDASSRTHLADDVAKTAESLGYDVIKMPDDLGGRGNNIAFVVVNKQILKSTPAKEAVPPVEAREITTTQLEQQYPKAKDEVDGRKIRGTAPNQESIPATFKDYEVLQGVREINMSEFDAPPLITKRTKDLADQIKQSGEISPLIVAIDSKGAYILEGGNRYDAMKILGAKSIPALVVVDKSEVNIKPAEAKPEPIKIGKVSDLSQEEFNKSFDITTINKGMPVESYIIFGGKKTDRGRQYEVGLRKSSVKSIEEAKEKARNILIEREQNVERILKQQEEQRKPPKPVQGEKQPWEMNRQEWETIERSNQLKEQYNEKYGFNSDKYWDADYGNALKALMIKEYGKASSENILKLFDKYTPYGAKRKAIIYYAEQQGKPVPPEVLAEYPDLKQPSAEPKPTELIKGRDFLAGKDLIGMATLDENGFSFKGIRHGTEYSDKSRGGTWYEIQAYPGAKSSYEAGKWYSREQQYGIGGKERFERDIVLKNPYIFDWSGLGEGKAPLQLAYKVLGKEVTNKLKKGITGLNAEKAFAKIENATANKLIEQGFDGVVFVDTMHKGKTVHPKQAFVFGGEPKSAEVKPEVPLLLGDKIEFDNIRTYQGVKTIKASPNYDFDRMNELPNDIPSYELRLNDKDKKWYVFKNYYDTEKQNNVDKILSEGLSLQDAKKFVINEHNKYKESKVEPKGKPSEAGFIKIPSMDEIKQAYRELEKSAAESPLGIPSLSAIFKDKPEVTKVVGDIAATEMRGEKIPESEQIETPLTKLRDTFKTAKKVRLKTEQVRHGERRERIAKAQGILESNTGESAFFKAKGVLKGEYTQPDIEPVRDRFTQQDIDYFNDMIRESDLRGWEKIDVHNALTKAFLGEAPQRHHYPLLRRVFGEEVADAMTKNPTLWAYTVDVLNLPRAIMASFDMSAPLRQGIIMSTAHPVIASKAFVDMVKSFGSEKYFQELETSIKKGKYADLREDAGLYQAEYEGKMGKVGDIAAKEEKFQSNLAEQIPGIGKIVRASNRAYVGFLNKLRADVFDKVASSWEGTEKSFEDYKFLAKFINHATGRGDLGKLSGEAPLINGLFFAPRLAISRVQTSTDIFRTTRAVRKIIAHDLISFVGTGLTILGLAALGGASIERDPRSSDFGKIKVGDSRLEFWGGYLPIARLVVQLILNERKSIAFNRILPVNRFETVSRFLQGKLSPVTGAAIDILRGETFIGEEVSATKESIGKQLYEHLTPLFIQDMIDAIRIQGLSGAIMTLPGFFGGGVQTWENTGFGKIYQYKNDLAKQTYGDRWDNLSPQSQELLIQNHPELNEMEKKAKAETKGLPDLRGMMREQEEAGNNVFNKLPKNIQKEMNNLYIGIGGLGRTIGEKWYMNDERYNEYQGLIRKFLEPKLQALITNTSWKTDNVETKRRNIEYHIKSSKKTARILITSKANKIGKP